MYRISGIMRFLIALILPPFSLVIQQHSQQLEILHFLVAPILLRAEKPPTPTQKPQTPQI
jgi:uncharacterized membrane protein YqaE (UPF0057 family)